MSIGFLFFKRLQINKPALWAFLFSINGLWAITITRQLGAFNNDLVDSVFILFGLQLWFISLYQFKDHQHLSYFKIFIAGILFGIAVGLKLTMGLFAIALFFMAICSPLVWQHWKTLFCVSNRLRSWFYHHQWLVGFIFISTLSQSCFSFLQ